MKKSALDIIKQIMDEVENTLPTQDMMLMDVQMMGFKIRQITGDSDSLSRIDGQVIESLWRVGKIDQIISASFDHLDEDNQGRLLDYLRTIEMRTEESLQHVIRTKRKPGQRTNKLLKLEVFKNIEESIVN